MTGWWEAEPAGPPRRGGQPQRPKQTGLACAAAHPCHAPHCHLNQGTEYCSSRIVMKKATVFMLAALPPTSVLLSPSHTSSAHTAYALRSYSRVDGYSNNKGSSHPPTQRASNRLARLCRVPTPVPHRSAGVSCCNKGSPTHLKGPPTASLVCVGRQLWCRLGLLVRAAAWLVDWQPATGQHVHRTVSRACLIPSWACLIPSC